MSDTRCATLPSLPIVCDSEHDVTSSQGSIRIHSLHADAVARNFGTQVCRKGCKNCSVVYYHGDPLDLHTQRQTAGRLQLVPITGWKPGFGLAVDALHPTTIRVGCKSFSCTRLNCTNCFVYVDNMMMYQMSAERGNKPVRFIHIEAIYTRKRHTPRVLQSQDEAVSG